MEVLRDDSEAATIFCITFANHAQKLPELEFSNFTRDFVAAYLFIECLKKLLPGSCASVSGAVVQGASEAAEVQ